MVSTARVVVIGGGFGGLNAAKGLKRGPAEVMVIDRTNHHLFQPLLYQVAAAVLAPGDIAVPIREILAKQRNATTIMAEVVAIEKEAKQVVLANGDRVSYDYLVVAPGARHAYFGHDEWEACAPGIKTLEDALRIRERLLISFEKAERCDSISEAEKYLNFVIIGGGPTGVEIAGAIAEIAQLTMIQNFRRINPERTKVYLVEGCEEILPPYPKRQGKYAREALEELGVEVLTNTMVTHIDRTGVTFKGGKLIPSRNIIWAAGNQASPLLKTLGIELDRAGRVKVQPDLTIAGYPEIFVIGDGAYLEDKKGKPLPGIAPTAIQQGKYVAKVIRKKIAPDKRKPFRYFDKGMMATIGQNKAVAVLGKFGLNGYLAWLAWCLIHIAYLIGFRNRILVLINWCFEYFTGSRGSRLIDRGLSDDH
ncbi:MAG: NAD(P)/FAD-dependent oxidoreductase [Verrucomicrobia bacterium]|nr:NAD(P)/FAD-dependent oxidoreductase [Verrucomicrobiota bacterium]